MKKLAAILLALAGVCAQAQTAAPISNIVISQYGQPVPFAQIRVCAVTSTGTPCVPTTPIYEDYQLSIPAPNPFTADYQGNYTVYGPAIAAPNLYLVQVSPQSGTTYNYVVSGPGGGSGGTPTVIEVNGTPTSPVTPVNFVDSATVTWTRVGATISATAAPSITWPASGDIVVSNGTNSPAGLAPTTPLNCVISQSGAFSVAACPGGGGGGSTIPGFPVLIFGGAQTQANQIFLAFYNGNQTLTIPSGCTGSKMSSIAATVGGSAPVATNNLVYTVEDVTTSTNLCTMSVTAGQSTATLAGSGGAVAAGDLVEAIPTTVTPSTGDATFQNWTATIVGTYPGGGGGSTPGGSAFELQYNNGSTLSGAAITGLVYSNDTASPPSAATSSQVLAVIGNGNITNAFLANTTMTINGVVCTLGSPCTVPGGGGSPGGSNGQLQVNVAGSFGGMPSMNGDATLNTTSGAITVTESGGVPFGTFAFQNYATPPAIGLTTANSAAFTSVTVSSLTIDSLNGCLSASSGVISAAGTCGSNTIWNNIGNPTGNWTPAMGNFQTVFTFGSATGSGAAMEWTDTASNTGTGPLGLFKTAAGSAATPWCGEISSGAGFCIDPATGGLTGVGFTTAATINWKQGTAPGTLPANTIQMYAPTSIGTSYALIWPSAAPTSSNGLLNCAGSSTPFTCIWSAGGAATTLASAEVVSFSATPTFSTTTNVSRIVLTGNITSFTLAAGSDGQDKKLCFQQGAGPYTVAPPSNVHGFFTIGAINADWNCQTFVYDNTDSIWQAVSGGVIDE